MASFEVVTSIAAPPERAWAVLADVDRWPEWAPTVTEVKALGNAGLAAWLPLSWRARRLVQPKIEPAVWKVAALEEGRSFTWASTAPGVKTLAYHLVEPAEVGTRLTLRIEMSGAMAWLGGLVAGRVIRSYMEQEAQALKARVEG